MWENGEIEWIEPDPIVPIPEPMTDDLEQPTTGNQGATSGGMRSQGDETVSTSI